MVRDEDDWVGSPRRGATDASRARPDFWRNQRVPLSITGVGLGLALIVLALAWLF